ncbi:MAG: SWIM zinc finger family protein [Bacteroidota bacterium]
MEITWEQLNKFVDEPYLSRGEKYCDEGLVGIVKEGKKYVKAQVLGSTMYEVTLRLINKRLSGECNCPAFEDFGPCKHIAATGLALLKGENYVYSPVYERRAQGKSRIEELLIRQAKSKLVALLLPVINENPDMLLQLGEEGAELLDGGTYFWE